MLIGVELVGDDGEPASLLARAVTNGTRGRGILVGTTGALCHVLKIRPPLVISRDDGDLLLAALDDALVGTQGTPPHRDDPDARLRGRRDDRNQTRRLRFSTGCRRPMRRG